MCNPRNWTGNNRLSSIYQEGESEGIPRVGAVRNLLEFERDHIDSRSPKLPKLLERIRPCASGPWIAGRRRSMGRIAPAKLIPLKGASWAFASQRQRNEWYRAKAAPSKTKTGNLSSTEIELKKKQAAENPAEALKLFSEAVNDWMQDLTVRSAPTLAMRDSLLQKLREGKLEACGVQSAPKQKRQLEIIPEHFFVDAKINWDANKVTNFGVTYSAVRVRRRSIASISGLKAGNALADAPASSLTIPVDETPSDRPRRKPGPPSAAEEIIRAYDRILQKGEVKEGMTIKAIHKKLLPDLKRNSTMFPNGRGLASGSFSSLVFDGPSGIPAGENV